MRCDFAVACLAAASVGSAVSGAYILTPLSGGLDGVTRQPGESFVLDLWLESDAADQINSAITRLTFSSGGLAYDSYAWSAPFANGSITDDSAPHTDDLGVTLDEDTLVGLGYPADVVDVELSNVILGTDRFTVGALVSLTFTVPADYEGPDEIVIAAAPDTFADGFNVVDVQAGPVFTLTIPSSGSLALVTLAGVIASARRRR